MVSTQTQTIERSGTLMRVIAPILILLISACGGDNPSRTRPQSAGPVSSVNISCDSPYEYEVPEQTIDGLPVAHINTKRIDEGLILNMASAMHCGEFDHQLNSILIAINGDLVFEKYFRGFVSADNRQVINYDKDTLHVLASTQKSVQSALMGIAVDQGYINPEASTLSELFPEYTNIDWNEPFEFNNETHSKLNITVENLLTMSAGFEWDEGSFHYGHPNNSLSIMNNNDDPFAHLFNLPLVSTPGESFTYNTGLSRLILEVTERSTGQNIQDYALTNFFAPLGIDNYYWEIGLSLRPRDMLKFGQLYINNGNWNGQQVISEEWVSSSLEKVFDLGSNQRITGYGYQWWWNEFNVNGQIYEAHAALGYGGQQILLFPEFDAVVVFTASEYPAVHGNPRTPYMWMSDYIVPALASP